MGTAPLQDYPDGHGACGTDGTTRTATQWATGPISRDEPTPTAD